MIFLVWLAPGSVRSRAIDTDPLPKTVRRSRCPASSVAARHAETSNAPPKKLGHPPVSSAQKRRRSLVEEESTHVIVGRHGSYFPPGRRDGLRGYAEPSSDM